MPQSEPSNAEWWANFERLLDEQNDWPTTFLFKFIVPLEQMPAFQALFEGEAMTTRASSKGNYISVTMQPVVDSADAVRRVYERAGQIKGVVSL